jgi:hypothetical protein
VTRALHDSTFYYQPLPSGWLNPRTSLSILPSHACRPQLCHCKSRFNPFPCCARVSLCTVTIGLVINLIRYPFAGNKPGGDDRLSWWTTLSRPVVGRRRTATIGNHGAVLRLTVCGKRGSSLRPLSISLTNVAQMLIQQIEPVDVSTTHSLTFTVKPIFLYARHDFVLTVIQAKSQCWPQLRHLVREPTRLRVWPGADLISHSYLQFTSVNSQDPSKPLIAFSSNFSFVSSLTSLASLYLSANLDSIE